MKIRICEISECDSEFNVFYISDSYISSFKNLENLHACLRSRGYAPLSECLEKKMVCGSDDCRPQDIYGLIRNEPNEVWFGINEQYHAPDYIGLKYD